MRSAMRASTSGGSGTGSGSGSGSGSGLGSGSGEGTGGVQSLHSSMSADASSGSQPSSQQSGGPSPARLVTIHLDKLDSGIWPNLVSGPAPTDPDPDPDVESSLIAALGEALGCPTSPPYSPSITFAGASEGAGVDAGASTLSVNTVNTTTSDDSDTVLGTRGRQRRRRESEARYNMDPTSLSLLGMQITAHHQAGALPGILGSAVGPEKEEAFEYFVRAWRAADVSASDTLARSHHADICRFFVIQIPLATRKLVNDYLPLPAPPAKSPTPAIAEHRSAPAMSTQGSADTFRASTSSSSTVGASSESSTITPIAHDERETSPHRQRLVARLGGPTALARLYVSFARLHFASSEMLRSPLAFPSGQLNNPFATGGPYFSPSPSRASSVASSSSKAQPASPRGVAAMPSPDAAGGAGASGAGMHGNPDPPTALAYLEEARRIDPNVWIEQHEWDEALELAEDALLEAETRREEARAAGAPAPSVDSVSGSGSGSILVPGAEQERKRGRRTRKMAGKGGESMTASGLSYSFTRSGKNGRSGHFGRARGQNHEEGGMIAVVSGAALISFALAGGVAAIGWWRRGQAATG